MELFLFILIILIFAAIIISLIYFRQRKINKILENKVVFVHSNRTDNNNLLLGKYGITLQRYNSSQVEVIFPKLNESGDLVYVSKYYYLAEISIPRSDKHKNKIEFQMAKDLAKYIKEHLQTEKEIEDLVLQYQQVHDLKKLVLKSDMYSNQIDVYEKAIKEIKKLIAKAKELEKMYIQIVREGLIGIKIANYNPNNIKDNQIAHQMMYKRVKDEYQYMKDTAHAYGELMRQRK